MYTTYDNPKDLNDSNKERKKAKHSPLVLNATTFLFYCAEGTVRGIGGRSEEDLGSKQSCEQLQRLD